MRKLGILILIMSLVLTACSFPIAIEDKSIISLVGFDKKEDKIQVTALIQNPKVVGRTQQGGKGPEERPVAILKTEGNTIDHAVHWSSNFVPRHIDWNHVQIVIVGEKLARSGLQPVLDFLQRQPEAASIPYLFVAKKREARDIIEKSLKFTDPPTMILEETVLPAVEHNNLRELRVYEILNELNSYLSDLTIPGIFMGSTDNYQTAGGHETYQISNELGVLRNGKLVGWLDKEASAGFLWIEEDRWDHAVQLRLKDKKAYVNHDITSNESQKHITFSNHKIEKVLIQLHITSKISEISGNDFKLDHAFFNAMEKGMNNFVKERVEKAVKLSQQYKTDIFGLGYEVRKMNQSYWEANKNRWKQEIYPNLPVEVQVQSIIENTGEIVELLETRQETK